MKTYNCPECGANVPLADMNVAADDAAKEWGSLLKFRQYRL